jgi:PAS domain S-box-containing protein
LEVTAMTDISGYSFESLRENREFVVFRGKRGGDSVLLVAPASEHPSTASMDQIHHAYSLRAELDAAWAIQPIDIVTYRGLQALLLHDPGGDFLDRLVMPPLSLKDFLRVAIAIAEALGGFHARGLVHRDIKPSSLMVNVSNGEAWLTNFGSASRLPRRRHSTDSPELGAGTLAYMAPEQTGRMNRSVDSRSDLYSFGVTLYEMLVGALPFAANDPMEWVHCHVAREAIPPAQRVPGTPAAISAIIMKLLAKTAEDRYQTPAGLQADLRRCLRELDDRGKIEPFKLGSEDLSGELLIQEKLYGRETEIETLLSAFDRVISQGTTELVMVSGYSGVGKSSVVNELHKALVPPRGLFASGKFDQYKRDIPYATLAQAFQQLARNILGMNEGDLSRWREAIREALGPNGQLMTQLIPELELIIGKQPPIAELSPQDAQNRFQMVFRRLLGVFATPEHPLALFLDDLQWLDAATLNLLQDLMHHDEVRHLLVVGAYRDNEVNAAHPLVRTLAEIRKAGAPVCHIELENLGMNDVNRLIADALHCTQERAVSLSYLVHEKTGGNPFFVNQFIAELAEEQLLSYDNASRTWIWDADRIQAKGFTDNVVELMVGKLSRFPGTTQESLKQLACLGSSADIGTLRLAYGNTEEMLHSALWEAVRTGLVSRLKDTYTFMHDRVHEAAYEMIPQSDRAVQHLRIARLLRSRADIHDTDENVFEIVNQYNSGWELVTDETEKLTLLRLNIRAGTKAKEAIAHASARNYFAQAAALLPPDAWSRNYDEAFELFLSYSECEYLTGNFLEADTLFDLLLRMAASDLDRAKVYSLRMRVYQVAGKYDEAVNVSCAALRLFAVDIPESDEELQTQVAAGLRDVPINLGSRAISDVLDLEEAMDTKVRAMINLLVEAVPCAYIGQPKLFPLLTLNAVNASLIHGNTDQSSFAYAVYAIMLVSVVGDIPSGFEFSEMALRLNDKFENRRLQGTLLHLHADHINFWRRPFATGLPMLDKAFIDCLNVGDLVYSGFLAFETVWQLIEAGESLESVMAQSASYRDFARQSRNEHIYQTILMERQFVASLQGNTLTALQLGQSGFDEAESYRAIVKATFGCGIFFYHVIKQILAFLDGRYAEALEWAAKAEPSLGAAMAMPIEATYHFFHALTLTALYPSASRSQQETDAGILETKLKKAGLWAHNCPRNFLARHLLISAEMARISGHNHDAMRLYDDAIRSAHESGLLHNEALANELAARFHLMEGFDTIALAYLRNARGCYQRWGAAGKVRQLDETYPILREESLHGLSVPAGDTPVGHLDFATVAKMSQAVSGEIVLEKLIQSLMDIAIQNAGAVRGLLILARGAEHILEAEATTERATVTVRLRQTPVTSADLPETILRYVIRTRQSVLLGDASAANQFSNDDYFQRVSARSILCLPLVKQTQLIGVLYLENNLAANAFTPDRFTVLRLLASQAANSLENARLYADLQKENLERKRAEEGMQRQKAHLDELLELAPQSIVLMDGDNVVTRINREFTRVFGYTPEEALGRTIADLIVPEDQRPSYDENTIRIAALERVDSEMVRQRKDGERLDVSIVAAPVPLSGGKIGTYVIYRDITARKESEEELRRSEANLRKAEAELAHVTRVTTMGQLAASIAHEVNQPISGIVINGNACMRWLDRAAEDPASIEEARATLLRMIRDGNRAGEIITRIRALFKKTESAKGPLDINETIKEIIGLAKSEMEKQRVALRLELTPDLQPVLGDKVQLQQVMLNLILNAIEAMTTVEERSRELLIQTQHLDGREVLVTVRDSGPGLDSASMDKVFAAFHTTKPGGLGMGLSISRSIVESHSGRLWAAAHDGPGATFRFTLLTTSPAEA